VKSAAVGAAGAVLCGGGSRRFGADKALAEVGGRAMAERVCAVLQAAGCVPVVVVGGDRDRLMAATGCDHVADTWPGEGPLGGVIDALRVARQRGAGGVVVAACDLPDLTVDAVVSVAGGTRPRFADADRPQPSLTYWPADVAEQLSALFDAGIRSLHEALDATGARSAAVDPAALRNVNSRADLANWADARRPSAFGTH
jgi:molybdopterin-guanine dinucleotide biosynthesis protein A